VTLSPTWQINDGQIDREAVVAFVEALLEAVPYSLHTILTDNGF
jgi:hypothetical protein